MGGGGFVFLFCRKELIGFGNTDVRVPVVGTQCTHLGSEHGGGSRSEELHIACIEQYSRVVSQSGSGLEEVLVRGNMKSTSNSYFWD